jgi:hypothetical protein
MKQNITLAMDRKLLKQARSLAAERGLSVSALLAEQLAGLVRQEALYRQARTKALAYLQSPFPLGGVAIPKRDTLHDRQGLR